MRFLAPLIGGLTVKMTAMNKRTDIPFDHLFDALFGLGVERKYNLMQMNDEDDNTRTHRYEQTGMACRLQSWGPSGAHTHDVTRANQLPEWARTIIDVARVGGNMPPCGHPPPDYILWFETDTDNHFIRYVNNG